MRERGVRSRRVQAGKVEPKVVRIFNERRSRTVMDCDTP